MIVQLTGEIPSLVFLRRDQPLGELPHLALRLLRDRPLLIGSPLGHAQPEDDRQRDHQAQEHRLPQQAPQVIPECGVPARDFVPLFRQIRVVQLFNLLGDGESGVTPRDNLGTQKAGAPKNLLGDRPIEERVECLPVVLELHLKTANLSWRAALPARAAPQGSRCCFYGTPPGAGDIPVLARARCREGSPGRRSLKD